MRIGDKDLLALSCLRKNARMKLTDMSRVTHIPVSTLFDRIRAYGQEGVVTKNTALLRFQHFGYHCKALVLFSARGVKEREKLHALLSRHNSVNSLFKVNNGWDFLAEVIFPGMQEAEAFLDYVGERAKVKDKAVFYIIDEVKKEAFLSNPQLVRQGAQ